MPKFGKNVLSQYLRTKCDRQLRLSLYTDEEQAELGWPVRLRARPAIQILRDAGHNWEDAKLQDLESAFPRNTVGRKERDRAQNERFRSIDLTEALRGVTTTPIAIVQGLFGDLRLRPAFLRAIGITGGQADQIPVFKDFQPDILLVQAAANATACVLPSGKLAPVQPNDPRKAILLCDIKHAGEANSSYSAEVALYAVLLANWLELEGLSGEFFVSAQMGLWTRAKETSAIAALMEENPAATIPERVAAFLQDWEWVDFETYFQTVEHFFHNDLPRVLAETDWRQLDWHVDSRCSNCDFLGHVPWLNREDRERVAANPDHYCISAAQGVGHLSRIPTLTRGGRKTLAANGHANVAAVAGLNRDDEVFEQHNALRADRGHLPHRAVALAAREFSLSVGTVTIDFPRWADLEVFITVNFDPGTGMLTAIGSEGRFKQRTPFQQPNEVSRMWGPDAHVLLDSTLVQERSAVLAFLSRIAEMFAHVHDIAADRGGPLAAKTRCHFYFWDDRQFEELTRAIGRHLPAITLPADDRLIRALVWLFPPEHVLENDALVLKHPVSAMKRIIQRDVRLPVPHALTLFGVAAAYHDDNFTPHIPGSYYQDPFSDMIPRERIYEIWSQEPLVKLGQTQRTLAQCISDYSDAVKKQVAALRSLVWKFRKDMHAGGRLPRDARPIDLRPPFNFLSMSEDGRLWVAWAKLEESCKAIEIRRNWMVEPDELEASYDILRLDRLLSEDGNRATFAASAACRDCKFRDGEAFLTLRIEAAPGLLNLSVAEAGRGHPTLAGDYRRMSDALGATLISFDRENLVAVVQFEEYHRPIRTELRARGVVDFNGPVSLVKRTGVPFAERVGKCVIALGRPAASVPAPETYAALGHAPGTNPARNDPLTPAGSVLWKAREVAVETTTVTADQIAGAMALIRPLWPVNDSQARAIQRCLTHRLSIVWGPPGTGKTTTAAAYAVARILAARAAGSRVRVLITGPTYTAFEKLFGEVCELLSKLRITDVPSFRVYSSFHTERQELPAGYLCRDMESKAGEAFAELSERLMAADQTVLVGTVVQQCYRMAELATQGCTAEFFDVVVMDESSQLDVSSSLFALSLLAPGFELALFGDHLQMPPVTQTQAPKNAEWLVGSIQTYLLHRHHLGKEPLLFNYRSSQPFVAFAKRIGYPPELEAHSPELKLHLVATATAQPAIWAGSASWFAGLASILDPAKALTAVTYADGRAGQANDFEADLVCSTIQQLFASVSARLEGQRAADGTVIVPEHGPAGAEEFWKKGVGIVAPHRAQRSIIVRKLWAIFPDHPGAAIDAAVDTVERFQGGERDTILISFGVGDPDLIATEEEFLLKLERTNVAISRARAKCVLFISDDLAYHLPADRATVETARAVKCYVNTVCQPRLKVAVPVAAGTRDIMIRD